MLSYSLRRWILTALAGLAVFFLYLFGLTRTGMLSADEPRYAAIGRAMAFSGDWVTPRLWGQPWFEKPALLYWMTATGFTLGLDEDLAPRLPVALFSIAFLILFWFLVRGQFGGLVASYSTAILSTSVGWLAYSRVAVTDLPLAVCFSVSMLLLMRAELSTPAAALVAGLFLGWAVLAKGLVPFVLFLPAIWYLRRRPRRLAWIIGIATVVAAPWYILVTVRNGAPFLNEFFLKHHLARFATGALQHERPVWFYLPVLLAAIFPWTTLIPGLFRRSLYTDAPTRFLLTWVLFGLVFFSASRNKLPGYLLPLLPALAILLGLVLAGLRDARWMLAVSGALLGLIPAIAAALPDALAFGASHVHLRLNYWYMAPALGLASVLWLLEQHRRRTWAVGTIAAVMTLLVVNVVWQTYPVLDQTVSARAFWHAHRRDAVICTDKQNRGWRYGLDYYAQKHIQDCNQRP